MVIVVVVLLIILLVVVVVIVVVVVVVVVVTVVVVVVVVAAVVVFGWLPALATCRCSLQYECNARSASGPTVTQFAKTAWNIDAAPTTSSYT